MGVCSKPKRYGQDPAWGDFANREGKGTGEEQGKKEKRKKTPRKGGDGKEGGG